MADTSKSSSHEQQQAEKFIAGLVEEWIGCSLSKNIHVVISDGIHIEPDLYSEDNRIIGEVFTHIGGVKVGQQHKLSQDILKMLLLEKSRGVQYRKIFVIVDDKVEKYLNGKSFVAESIRRFNIEIKRIYLPAEMCETIANAQKRQIMVNL